MKLLTRLLTLIALLPCLSSASLRPQDYFGLTTADKIQACVDAAVATEQDVDLRGLSWDKTVYVKPKAGDNYVTLKITGSARFGSLRYTGTGPAIEFQAGKDCQVDRLCIIGNPQSDGVVFRAPESSSGNLVSQCKFQSFRYGVWFVSTDNADSSVCTVAYSKLESCASGVKMTGPNALDLVTLQTVASSCGIAIDLRDGGSNFQAIACGGSYCNEFVVVKAGFQGKIDVTSFEGKGIETFARIGGDDAGGYGAHTSVSVSAMDVRGVQSFAVVNCSGSVTLQAHKATGVIRGENKSLNTCELALSNAVGKLPQTMIGKFSVKVQ